MTSVLIDTHVLAWSLVVPSRLSKQVQNVLLSGTLVYVPPCALHEITLKVRHGKWPEMEPYFARLDSLCVAQGFHIAPYTAQMAMKSGAMLWEHRDPFDRMIAATALEMSCLLISADSTFDGLIVIPEWKGRFWK